MTYGDAHRIGLDPDNFIQNEKMLDSVQLTCISPDNVYSLKRLSFREKDIFAYIGLLRTKVKKGYWSQFAFVLHLHNPRSFIVILSEDMVNNIMQRFVWKMFHPMQFRVLMTVKRHLLFEDINAITDCDIFDDVIVD
jgi:hypothetical protein